MRSAGAQDNGNGVRLTTFRSRFELCIKQRGDVFACAQGYNISCAQG